MKLLWLFLPDEALVLVIVALGLGLIIGLVRPRTVAGVIGCIAVTAAAAPFLEAILDGIPTWLLLLLALSLGFWVLRQLFALLLGRGAADEMVGQLAADVVRFSVRVLMFPFTAAWRWARRYH